MKKIILLLMLGENLFLIPFRYLIVKLAIHKFTILNKIHKKVNIYLLEINLKTLMTSLTASNVISA